MICVFMNDTDLTGAVIYSTQKNTEASLILPFINPHSVHALLSRMIYTLKVNVLQVKSIQEQINEG